MSIQAQCRHGLALLAARLTAFVGRRLGHGGSSLPGVVARKLDPSLLSWLAGQLPDGVVMITGTNGKTTTSTLLTGALRAGGRTVTRNVSGANLITGLTATLATDLSIHPDLAVLETDEATVPRAAAEVRPRMLVVTNFFRDQLDRYGELSHTVELVRRGLGRLAPDGIAVLNADDPFAAVLGGEAARPWFYGLEPGVTGADAEEAGDARLCPRCGSELAYARRFYAHLGLYRCPACEFRRPPVDVAAVRLDREGDGRRTIWVRYPGGELTARVPLPGTYNVYNAVAAIAAALALGVEPEHVVRGLETSGAAFGRMEQMTWQGREIRVALVKNPAGFNEVLRTLAEDPRDKDVLIAINDRYADGRDVSWLWDVDFEGLGRETGARHWWVAGRRGRDMALRLKYAGVPPDQVTTGHEDPGRALEAVLPASARPLYVLPTYTAMLEMRRRLWQAGVVRHFREG